MSEDGAMDRVTETEADLPALLDRVERGEEIEITRGGRPVAKLVAFDPVRPKPEDVVAHFRALRENLAAAEFALPASADSVSSLEPAACPSPGRSSRRCETKDVHDVRRRQFRGAGVVHPR